MGSKFDENAAVNIPKVKNSSEPELPWNMGDNKAPAAAAGDKGMAQDSPLQIRGIFIALFIMTVFVVVINSIVNMSIDNVNMNIDILRQERKVLEMKSEMERLSGEKALLAQSADKLEKSLSDLNAQKELYTSVIETLAKKTDDVQSDN